MMRSIAIAAVLAAGLSAASLAHTTAPGRQSNPPPDEVKRLQERSAAIEAFNTLTPGQRAEVVRRHVQECLDRLVLSAEQRAVVSEILTTLVTPESYTARTADEEREFRARTQPVYERAEKILGRQLNLEIFYRGMTLENIEAVKRDSTSPNIIFILADDLGYGEVGSYGQEIMLTPNVDRLAAEGMRFTHFYAGSTVCAPSRSVLMTGLHLGHTRVRGNAGGRNMDAQTLQPGDVTIARVL
ncbi:MAG: sulfatase-like hydrolase/transferase, partial [Vicinamibacterales bacterium]|nr:sulfatase-like hydrolase/transferase [Vicinamibacterales bacterium]